MKGCMEGSRTGSLQGPGIARRRWPGRPRLFPLGTSLIACLPAALAAALAGCGGPARHPVEGTVTLGHSPLSSATVTFVAEGEGDASAQPAEVGFARTDADGHFVIEGSHGQPGLPAGTYRVRMSTLEEDDDGGLLVPERVPARYNVHSELLADVPSDSGRFDFVLDLDGPIMPSEF